MMLRHLFVSRRSGFIGGRVTCNTSMVAAGACPYGRHAAASVRVTCIRGFSLLQVPSNSKNNDPDAVTTSTSTSTSTRWFSSSSNSSHHDAKALAQSQQQQQQVASSTPKSWWASQWEKFSIRGQRRRIVLGEELYQAAFRQANDPRWYGPGRIPRTFRSRHAMITLHLWLLHKRLISARQDNGPTLDADSCLRVQEELFEIFWDDTLCRIRGQGVREMSVHKSLLKVQQYTFLHLFHYDHIYQALASSQSHLDPRGASLEDDDDEYDDYDEAQVTEPNPKVPPPSPNNDDDEDDEVPEMDPLSILDPTLDLTLPQNRISELKKLLWMHVFVRDDTSKLSDDHLTRLAYYIEAQYHNILLDWPGHFVEQGRVQWVDLPDFSTLKDNQGRILKEQPLHPDDVLPSPWLTNITLRGQTYYWNPNTGKSQWERPSWNNKDHQEKTPKVA